MLSVRECMCVCLSFPLSFYRFHSVCIAFSVFFPLTPSTYKCCEGHRGQKVLLLATYLEVLFVCVFVSLFSLPPSTYKCCEGHRGQKVLLLATYLEVLFVCVFVSLFSLPPSTWQMLRRISRTNSALLSNVSRSCSAHVCVSLPPSLSPSNYLTKAAKDIENEQYTCQRRIQKLFCGFKRHVPNHCIIIRKTRDEAF